MSEENGAHGRCHVYTSQRLISPEWVVLSPWHRALAVPTIFLLRMTKIIWRQENNNVRSEESGFPRYGYQCPHSQVNGDLYADIPVVTVHTLGDLFVPIKMQQIYRQRMEENGWGDNLVQRAVRAPSHCDFSIAEFNSTLDAMLTWEQDGVKPAGDDLLDAELMADPAFGCTFTQDGFPQEGVRAFMPACPEV